MVLKSLRSTDRGACSKQLFIIFYVHQTGLGRFPFSCASLGCSADMSFVLTAGSLQDGVPQQRRKEVRALRTWISRASRDQERERAGFNAPPSTK